MKRLLIDEIKELFIGKTVKSVERGYGEACICEFRLEKKDKEKIEKTCVQIHGNDLASWVKEIKLAPDDTYIFNTIGKLLSEVHEFANYKNYFEDDIDLINIAVVGKSSIMIKDKTPGETIFRCNISNEWDEKTIKDEQFFDFVRDAILLGAHAVFLEDCYKHLKFPYVY